MDRWVHGHVALAVHEDLDDWLAGRDDLVEARNQKSRRELIESSGGEIG